MNRHRSEQSSEGLLGLVAVGLLVAVVWGAKVLDQVPWLLPWAMLALLLRPARLAAHARPRTGQRARPDHHRGGGGRDRRGHLGR